MIPPCPNCGSRFTYVNVQARGPGQFQHDEQGQLLEVGYDKLYFVPSKVVRCSDCGKIRRDLVCVNREVIER